jgi:hypothetical protein
LQCTKQLVQCGRRADWDAGLYWSRAGVVVADKNDPHSNKRKAKVAKRPAPVNDEFRNFDERMAAKSARRPGVVPKAAAVAPPTFVMAAPTFQLYVRAVWCSVMFIGIALLTLLSFCLLIACSL